MGFVYHKNITGTDLHDPKAHTHPGNELTLTFSAKTDDYIITSDDVIITVDATNKNITITLPSASGVENRFFYIKKIDSTSNSVIVEGNGGETVDGYTSIEMQGYNDCITVGSTGSRWYIL